MINITMSAYRPADNDAFGRSHIGYRDGMSAQEIYDANHGIYVMSTESIKGQQYALFSAGGTVRLAVKISAINPVPNTGKKAIWGEILTAGNPVYDAYVNGPSPTKSRNPVAYFDDAEHDTHDMPCRCGCGELVDASRVFVTGHDQRALHARITERWGSVVDFLDWYDSPSTIIERRVDV